jgi:SNF2 family DNA or RNA helicase
MIEHYVPFKKGRVGLMYAEMSTAARTDMLEAFADVMTENKQGAVVRRRKENIQFLIGTTPILSKGLQLTRACNVVLMEPDNEFHRELQGYARVNRIGQRNPWTFSYRLIDDGSEVENSILQRQKERGELPGRVLKAVDVEKMGPMDDWGLIDYESDDLERPVSWAAPKKMLTRLEPTLRRVVKVPDLRGSAPDVEQRAAGDGS